MPQPNRWVAKLRATFKAFMGAAAGPSVWVRVRVRVGGGRCEMGGSHLAPPRWPPGRRGRGQYKIITYTSPPNID